MTATRNPQDLAKEIEVLKAQGSILPYSYDLLVKQGERGRGDRINFILQYVALTETDGVFASDVLKPQSLLELRAMERTMTNMVPKFISEEVLKKFQDQVQIRERTEEELRQFGTKQKNLTFEDVISSFKKRINQKQAVFDLVKKPFSTLNPKEREQFVQTYLEILPRGSQIEALSYMSKEDLVELSRDKRLNNNQPFNEEITNILKPKQFEAISAEEKESFIIMFSNLDKAHKETVMGKQSFVSKQLLYLDGRLLAQAGQFLKDQMQKDARQSANNLVLSKFGVPYIGDTNSEKSKHYFISRFVVLPKEEKIKVISSQTDESRKSLQQELQNLGYDSDVELMKKYEQDGVQRDKIANELSEIPFSNAPNNFVQGFVKLDPENKLKVLEAQRKFGTDKKDEVKDIYNYFHTHREFLGKHHVGLIDNFRENEEKYYLASFDEKSIDPRTRGNHILKLAEYLDKDDLESKYRELFTKKLTSLGHDLVKELGSHQFSQLQNSPATSNKAELFKLIYAFSSDQKDKDELLKNQSMQDKKMLAASLDNSYWSNRSQKAGHELENSLKQPPVQKVQVAQTPPVMQTTQNTEKPPVVEKAPVNQKQPVLQTTPVAQKTTPVVQAKPTAPKTTPWVRAKPVVEPPVDQNVEARRPLIRKAEVKSVKNAAVVQSAKTLFDKAKNHLAFFQPKTKEPKRERQELITQHRQKNMIKSHK